MRILILLRQKKPLNSDENRGVKGGNVFISHILLVCC